jgi:intracellular sulfur oxidation DsrE/DsrF family protein
MDNPKEISDDLLAAHVDGLLDEANSALVIQAIDNDPGVRERYLRIHRTKDMMKLAYGKARPPSDKRRKHSSFWHINLPRVAAFIAVVSVSFAAGQITGHNYGLPGDLPLLAEASAAREEPDKILLHISESDPEMFRKALDYTKKFLQEHESRGGSIDVVANAGGVDLLRPDISPLAEEIISIMHSHDNVHFIACANAIRALRKKGIEPEFFESVYTREPAMDFIINRVKSGWEYIKVKNII